MRSRGRELIASYFADEMAKYKEGVLLCSQDRGLADA